MTRLTKTDKTPDEFEGQKPVLEAHLEIYDRRRNHNKFWRIYVYGNYVVRHWGRHNSRGQWSVRRAWNEWGAQNAALLLIIKKRDKGYTKEASMLDRFAREI